MEYEVLNAARCREWFPAFVLQEDEVAVIRADAGLKAQITMGEADGEAAKIYADAFTRDKDFYAFYRRMEAYKQAFGTGGSTMILAPDGDFLRYFNDSAVVPPAVKK